MRSVTRLALVLFVAACGPAVAPPPPAAPVDRGDPMPGFALVDVNPASATASQPTGPATFRGKVSGWYFTHSS